MIKDEADVTRVADGLLEREAAVLVAVANERQALLFPDRRTYNVLSEMELVSFWHTWRLTEFGYRVLHHVARRKAVTA